MSAAVEEAAAANGGYDGGGVDLGILDAAVADNNDNDNEESGANNDDEDDDNSSYSVEPSSLYDVYSSLRYANYTGSCCAADKADGTTLTPALPSILGLRVNGVGDLPLPLSDWHAKTLKSNRNTVKINNGSYRKTYTVDSARVRIKNPTWKASLEKLVQTVAYKLGVDPTKLTAELHSLMYMEKGSHVERCKNSDEGQNVLGTLFVQLPSVFTGGRISIYNVGNEDVDDDEDGEEEDASTFQLGASGESSFSCHFVCHYKDCEYEFAKIKSGSRVLLRYSLRYNRMQQKAPTASTLNNSMSSLKWSLENLPPADRMLLIPMAKEYTAASLAHTGINAFAHHHRAYVEAIKAAAGEGWKLLIVTAELEHTRKTGYYGNVLSNDKDSLIVQLFDEKGNDITEAEKWLKDVVDFDSVDDGMMLASDEASYAKNWGGCTSYTSSSTYYGDTDTKKRKYRASFILAYDTSFSESELKCLSGIEGVAEVAEKVVATRDYNLLERMLKVVERKEKSKFDLQSCQKLLHMLIRAKSKNSLSSDRIDLVKRILSGLSPSLEPDDELFSMILSAVDKFGHDNITTGISAMLNDQARLKGLKLSVFLRRVEFILTLNKRLDSETSYLQKSISDLSSSNANSHIGVTSDVLNTTIFSMITEHGWEKMASVVEATLSFLHNQLATFKSIPTLLDRALLIWKLHTYPCDFLQTCLVSFAKDFVASLSRNSSASLNLLRGNTQKAFIKAICYTMTHVTNDNQRNNLGRWAIKSPDVFSALLEAIPAQSTSLGYNSEVLLRDILNNCLVQNSTSWYHGSRYPRREDGTANPSVHIQLVLEKHPNLPRMMDEDGRVTLHYAAASRSDLTANQRAPYDTIKHILDAYPEGASIRDPVTRLYPFMLAADAQNVYSTVSSVSASFSLLLANPSLVMSGIQEDVDTGDSRKRKRSASMGRDQWGDSEVYH